MKPCEQWTSMPLAMRSQIKINNFLGRADLEYHDDQDQEFFIGTQTIRRITTVCSITMLSSQIQ
jgi:hypothetical protein